MRLRQVLKVSKLLKDINVDPFINIPLILGWPGARAPCGRSLGTRAILFAAE